MEPERRGDRGSWSVRRRRTQAATVATGATEMRLLTRFPGCSYAERIGELLLGCGRGELADLGRLYDETIAWVYPMACGVARDGDAALRLTKDAYQRIWTVSPQFDPGPGCAVRWVTRQLREQFTGGPVRS